MKMILATALLAGFCAPAAANVIYKSIDSSGTVIFSDTPPDNARIIEERVVGAPSSPSAPSYGAAPSTGLEEAFAHMDYDAALAQANARLDQAERALAQARAGAASRFEGLRLPSVTQVSSVNSDHIEFCKRDVKLARQALLDLLRSRQLASGRKLKDG